MLGTDADHAQQHEQMIDTLQGAGLPNVVACIPFFADCSTDEQFDFGLDLMISGIRARVGDRAPVA